MERLSMTELYRLSKAVNIPVALLAQGVLSCIGDGSHADSDGSS